MDQSIWNAGVVRRTMANRAFLITTIAMLTSTVASTQAAQLHVEPVLLELNAPAAAAVLTLRNDDDSDALVQTRIFRWSSPDGNDTLEPTPDVVVSPPSVRLAPHADYVVRVVRLSRQPVGDEESYRVIVDQIPTLRPSQRRAVEVLIRQSIPVFFRGHASSPAQVAWRVQRTAGKLVVTGSNAGGEHLRIASLRLRASDGSTISFGNGLAGYVLGRSARSWVIPSTSSGFVAGRKISVMAETDKGPINATVDLEGRP
jgi:fimbrial chaperone protein